MAINKIEIIADGIVQNTLDFTEVISGLSAGSHTVTVKAFDGVTEVHNQTKNITIAGGTGLDPDYQDVLNYATTNSIPLPDATQQQADSDLVSALKTLGVWSLLDMFFKFKSTAPLAFKAICWKRLIQGTMNGSITNTNLDIGGNGSNGFFNPLFTTSDHLNYTLTNSSFNIFFTSISQSGVFHIDYGLNGTNNTPYFQGNRNGSGLVNLNGNLQTGLQPITTNGLVSISRLNGTVYHDNPNYNNTIPDATTSIDTGTPYLFARNDNGATSFSSSKASYLFSGANMNPYYDDLKTLLA